MNKIKVLIVEDESIIAKDLQTILREAGYDVPYTAATSKEALKYTEEIKPDLILMDVVIKGSVDGISTAQVINGLYDIPIIFLSAYSDKMTLERARTIGSFGYLLKPCDEKELLIAVDFGLQKARMDRLIKTQNKLYSAALENLEKGVIVLNDAGGIELINPQAQILLGWKEADIQQLTIHHLLPELSTLILETETGKEGGKIKTNDNHLDGLVFKPQRLMNHEEKICGTLIYVYQDSAPEKKKAS